MGEFDASDAARRALGTLDDNPEQAVDVDPATDTGGEGGGSPPDSGGSGSPLHSLLFAPERGPTQPVIASKGIGDDIALVLDGTTDWVLDVIGGDKADELGNSLGPLGKITLGFGGLLTTDGTDEGVQDSVDDDPVDGDVGPVVGDTA